MAKKKTVEQIIQLAQVREDREYDHRVLRIKRAVAQSNFLDIELSQIEEVVFRAFGRTKLA